MELDEIQNRWSKGCAEMQNFFIQNAIDNVNVSTIIYFLDSKGIFIGINSIDGNDYIGDLSGLVIGIKNTRREIERLLIEESFSIIELELNNKI